MRTTHEVKSWPRQFEAVAAGRKTAELRRNDRDYQVGDLMRLREFDPDTQVYSGRTVVVKITHKLDENNLCAVSKEALKSGYAILSVRLTVAAAVEDA